jgi:hypothetical protein
MRTLGRLDRAVNRVPKLLLVSRLGWLLLVAACGRNAAKDQAPCDTVGGRVQMVARAELAAVEGLPAETRKAAELDIDPLKDEVERACTKGGWPVETRACMLTAKTGAALQQCAAALTPEQRDPLAKVKR